jgi:hypothetical protein
MIYQRVRAKKDGNRIRKDQIIGIMMADKIDGEIRIGWAAWNYNKHKYMFDFAFNLAKTRMEKGFGLSKGPAFKIRPDLARFLVRVRKYFKDTQFSDDVLEMKKRFLVDGEDK